MGARKVAVRLQALSGEDAPEQSHTCLWIRRVPNGCDMLADTSGGLAMGECATALQGLAYSVLLSHHPLQGLLDLPFLSPEVFIGFLCVALTCPRILSID